MTTEVNVQYEALRQRAIKRLKKRHDFHGHLLVYALINTFIVIHMGGDQQPGFLLAGVPDRRVGDWRGDERLGRIPG